MRRYECSADLDDHSDLLQVLSFQNLRHFIESANNAINGLTMSESSALVEMDVDATTWLNSTHTLILAIQSHCLRLFGHTDLHCTSHPTRAFSHTKFQFTEPKHWITHCHPEGAAYCMRDRLPALVSTSKSAVTPSNCRNLPAHRLNRLRHSSLDLFCHNKGILKKYLVCLDVYACRRWRIDTKSIHDESKQDE